MKVEGITVTTVGPGINNRTEIMVSDPGDRVNSLLATFQIKEVDLHDIDKGATITIEPVINYDDEFDDMWDQISLADRLEILKLLSGYKRITAMKCVRQHTGVGVKEAKKFIDSEWIWKLVKDIHGKENKSNAHV